jgi:uncharacterized membrane protein YhaH (DUF805 family)
MEEGVGLVPAVRQALSQYATFRGRATRAEFWWFFLLLALVIAVGALVDRALGTAVAVQVLSLPLLLPFIAVGVRRLHDIGRSGWWYLVAFVPAGALLLYVFWVLPGKPVANRHGPVPAPV